MFSRNEKRKRSEPNNRKNEEEQSKRREMGHGLNRLVFKNLLAVDFIFGCKKSQLQNLVPPLLCHPSGL